MKNLFHKRISLSLADENLQAALDANAERRISVRLNAFASLENAQELRQRARAVRSDVITHLDQYLDQFTTNLHSHGIQVHRVDNATQAVEQVIEISRLAGAKLVAKSKTMVSEEIELNQALEAAGLKVVETDLGEYIVQIRHEPPSHIITPAVHLRRVDVGRTFHEVLGIPLTEDIPTMTTAARQTLREVFLAADVGVSGVNFGVADTGTLCVVTNEGNGRMVTTLPRVHIALMGIERIVPNMDDLALMLSLLPRSATGQKLSVYTNLINAPRGVIDPDGPPERHVILVDNGRGKVRESPLAEILYCIRCGACLNACPVFREIGGHAYIGKSGRHSTYPGPMGSVLAPALFGQPEFGQLARASTLCGACKEACPVEIDLPKLLLLIRAGHVSGETLQAYGEKKPPPRMAKSNPPLLLAMGLRIFTWAAISSARFTFAQRLAGWMGSLASWLTPSGKQLHRKWLRLPAFTGWGLGKDFPAPSTRPFHQRWNEIHTQNTTKHTLMQGDSPPVISEYRENPSSADKLDFFSSELKALGANLVICNETEVATRVVQLLSEHATAQILSWDAEYLPGGLLAKLIEANIGLIFPTGETKLPSSQVRVGLTGASAGVANTGSLLITSDDGQPLLASLLPEVHIAILRERDLYSNLSEMLSHHPLNQTSAAVLISGPSRTADIEMTLTIGVHGPGKLYVILIRETK